MTRAQRDEHLASVMAQINAIMKANNISQAELARRADMHPADVSKALNLRTDPRASTIIAMLRAIDHHMTVTPDQPSVVE